MPFPDLILHLLNFVAPALFMALLLALMARGMFGRSASARGFWMQAGLNFVVGVAVLTIGLWVTGRDGKMATYAALVVVCGSVQWALSRR
ncbi:hypothetical protein ACSFA3_10870 [Variovorax sp. RHLX14]|uniref:hypothetical protein n=1 Tax=Variovorax sp. RHLX14 TaxID=1259731 RepID=UPI003F450A14